MGEPWVTLAVWDVVRRRWAAFVTSRDRAFVDKLHGQLVGLVMVFAVTVDIPGDGSDDAVEAALAMLPKVHPEAVFQSYFDLVQAVSLDEIPPGLSRARMN